MRLNALGVVQGVLQPCVCVYATWFHHVACHSIQVIAVLSTFLFCIHA